MKKVVFKSVSPYLGDAMRLPVEDIESAIPFYEKIMGFRIVSRNDHPQKSVVLGRDGIQLGLEENGEDPTQDGCFIEVSDANAALAELESNGLDRGETKFRVDHFGDTSYKVFFVVAPDGLCYCLGERLEPETVGFLSGAA